MLPLKFVDVILPLALPKQYTYSIPEELADKVKIGKRIVVQLGQKKLYTAIAYSLHNNEPEDYKTKDILQVIDQSPLISGIQIRFWEWMASYYLCTLGEVMKAALPSGLKLESETQVVINNEYDLSFPLSEAESLLMSLLEEGGSQSILQIVTKSKVPNTLGNLNSLLEKNILSVFETIESSYRPKYETIVRLHSQLKTEEDVNRVFGELTKAPAQQKTLMAFLSLTAPSQSVFNGFVSRKDLLDKASTSTAVLNALVDKNIFETELQEVSRLSKLESTSKKELELTPLQKTVLDNIREEFQSKHVVLLHGVTSSGKTEMYIKLIEEQLEQGKQVLYLLPEIALTAQIINRLKLFFGNRVGVYHSKFSDNQRVEIYQNLLEDVNDHKNPTYDIILGVRSSIFLPFKRLGLIIIDEEHENTFKQYNPAPRYHARDSAIVLATLHNAKVLLGTATPSVESYYNAQIGKYGFATIKQRYREIELPKIILVDTLIARKKKQMKSVFSPQLIDAISEALANEEQVILFQNRRGYAPFVECEECAWIPQCKHCAVSLTYHMKSNQLVCHYCSYATQNLSSCLACGSTRLSTKGFGTEKVEDELSIFFPLARIERMDLDTTRSRNSYERIITEFELGKIDILIGTQMVTKGLDFDRVSLVGILNADNMLNFPDFRAYERSFQLMAQVSGRAGRKIKQGKVIIQTSNPENHVIQNVTNNNYEQLFKEQLLQRKEFRYPPYYRLIRISLRHRNQKILNIASKQLAVNLKAYFNERILGPEVPIIGRIQNFFIEDILIKLERNIDLQKAKGKIVEEMNRIKEYKPFSGLYISPDVDPM